MLPRTVNHRSLAGFDGDRLKAGLVHATLPGLHRAVLEIDVGEDSRLDRSGVVGTDCETGVDGVLQSNRQGAGRLERFAHGCDGEREEIPGSLQPDRGRCLDGRLDFHGGPAAGAAILERRSAHHRERPRRHRGNRPPGPGGPSSRPCDGLVFPRWATRCGRSIQGLPRPSATQSRMHRGSPRYWHHCPGCDIAARLHRARPSPVVKCCRCRTVLRTCRAAQPRARSAA